ncbi:probable G-protein coupled receptor CG31760 [Macrosteles quadrilineatus]|uniref:probable G-protein coupled receptor CG31760 n=1 Tax=Macrosteles quadrilineatus TaxID=74068 RepID=UPI0023E13A11|nr:probable G-protein coupled receptor CG31760 [Macrosteles quadrilineatus]
MAAGWRGTVLLGLLASLCTLRADNKDKIEEALELIHDVSTGNMGTLCVSESYRTLAAHVSPTRYDSARQKADLVAMLLQDLGIAHHNGLMDAVGRTLLLSDRHMLSTRVLALNTSTGHLSAVVIWRKSTPDPATLTGAHRVTDEQLRPGGRPDATAPWYEDAHSSPALRSPKFMTSPDVVSYRGWWTFPYYSCYHHLWIMSYTVVVPPSPKHEHGIKGLVSFDVDVSSLEVNQCDHGHDSKQVHFFRGSHKCHNTTQCIYFRKVGGGGGWQRGNYMCKCKPGFYSRHTEFNGTLVEAAWAEKYGNGSTSGVYDERYRCRKCAPGCSTCTGPKPCLAHYNWPFRITLLCISLSCVFFTLGLILYVYNHRKLKVFKVASPIFLSITLLGCAIMYLEMAAIFPILDIYSCIATKWCRHLGFCVTYTALLMKTWRVSLTYRVKSAHKVKLTDKQLLQWMFPILLVMLIYLSTWTISAPPKGEEIYDSHGLRFKQCTFNWWDHSLAIGEVLFLAWGIRVCYNVRHAESLYNEARLITIAIYNIAGVNIAMVAFHLFLFPQAGPDIKYFLGFIRTQLSTSVTIALVFGPKVLRVLRGQGDQWDNRARARGVTASFSLNGIGLVPDEAPDLFQENEELKEEIQKLAGQMEFMKIVHMEMNNRHLKMKPGGYFSSGNTVVLQSPVSRTSAGFVLGKSFSTTEEPDERV